MTVALSGVIKASGRNIRMCSPTLTFIGGRFLTWVTSIESRFPGGSDGKVSAYNVGDLGLIPASGRSSGEGNGNLFQYSYLENPMDRGVW